MANRELRRAVQADSAALADCIDRAYAGYRSRLTDLPDVAAGIPEDIRDNIVWVVAFDGEIVGGLILIAQPDCLLLANIAIDPDFAGKGLGGELLEQAEAECRALGKPELRLATHVDMPENVRLYERRGWTETGHRGNKILMAKTID